MLQLGRSKITNCQLVSGDAQYLPFTSRCVKLAISNLMYQWVTDKYTAFREVSRILKNDGVFIFATLVNPSLWQLQKTWQQFDNHDHILKFHEINFYQQLIQDSGFETINCETGEYICYFNNYMDLMKHFKQSGTSIPKSKGAGLSKRGTLIKVNDYYRNTFASNGLIPLSYHYAIFTLRKKTNDEN